MELADHEKQGEPAKEPPAELSDHEKQGEPAKEIEAEAEPPVFPKLDVPTCQKCDLEVDFARSRLGEIRQPHVGILSAGRCMCFDRKKFQRL